MKRLCKYAYHQNIGDYGTPNDVQLSLIYSRYPFLESGEQILYQGNDNAAYGSLYYDAPNTENPSHVNIFAVELYYFRNAYKDGKRGDYYVSIARKVDEDGELNTNIVYTHCDKVEDYKSHRAQTQKTIIVKGMTLRNLQTSNFDIAMSKLRERFPSINQDGEE